MLGMKEADFYNTTPRTFTNILNGHYKKLQRENDREEATYRLSMELHRQQIYYGLLPHMAKKDRVDLQKFMPLPWDKKKESTKPKTREEIIAYWKEIDEKERAKKDKKQ